MSDNKLTCKPLDSQAAAKCSNSHFDNPFEVSIPPHAPNRKKSRSGSKKEKDDHDSQRFKTASKLMAPESQPHTLKDNPTERADTKGQPIPDSSGNEHDDNADKASQYLSLYFSAGQEHEETTDETVQPTQASSGADETGQSIPNSSGNDLGETADETEDSCQFNCDEENEENPDETSQPNPTEPEVEQGQKPEEIGQSVPNSSGNKHGEAADKTGEPNLISPVWEQGPETDEPRQSVLVSTEEEYDGNADETEDSFPFNSEEEYDESPDEAGQPSPIYSGEEYGEGPDEPGQVFPVYSGEEDGEGGDEAGVTGEPHDMPHESSSLPHLYDPLDQQSAPAPADPKNIFDLTPFVLPAWAQEFKATHCGKSNDSAYNNPSFYRRYYSTQVYVSRCCESGSHFYGTKPFNESYCNELLRKYREPQVSFTKVSPSEGKKEVAPTATPSKTNTANVNANTRKEEEEPGCCKWCCCCECCCKWYSWIIWIILLINVLVLVYVIWWEGCGLVVLVFEDMTDWEHYNFFRWAKDILGLDYPMQLFLAFLGYFAYFFLVCCCYIFCKKCTIPDDPKGFCSCKEVKLIIHIIYGAVMIVYLYLEVDYWRNNRDKFKGEEQVRLDKEHACLELCLWLTFALLVIGVIVFVIYSLERRQIRKRIHPETGNTQTEQNRGAMSNRPYSAFSNDPPGPGNNAIPAAMIIRDVCGETVAPMFQRPQIRRVQSFTDCGFSHEMYQASTVCPD